MYLSWISDGLMILAAVIAAGYCMVLSRRLKRFNSHEEGMGGAIAVLSAQVDDMAKMLQRAEKSATASAAKLQDLTARGDEGAKKLEVLLASLHDLPDPARAEPDNEPPAKFIRSDTAFNIAEAAE